MNGPVAAALLTAALMIVVARYHRDNPVAQDDLWGQVRHTALALGGVFLAVVVIGTWLMPRGPWLGG